MLEKDDVLRFRVSAREKEVIERAAARDGLSTSAWLRQLALREAGWKINGQRPGESFRDFVLRRLDAADAPATSKKGKR